MVWEGKGAVKTDRKMLGEYTYVQYFYLAIKFDCLFLTIYPWFYVWQISPPPLNIVSKDVLNHYLDSSA